ncbi:MAG: single-stranded-DNA-specific exonuclease RecJ [Flavobacteriales bacterium]|nr:single-stranded-DNA-specific exonuclease RecJ [Flavobacteriales bacterium]
MRWTFKPEPNNLEVTELAKTLSVSNIQAQLLVQRGIVNFNQAKNFFRPKFSDLHNPYLMKDMGIAVARIESAIANQETILVYGDYDVDGTTAVSLVSAYLKTIYDRIDTYIPDRYDEGYGISFKGIDYADDNNITLIIALDCGIKAIDKVAYANQKNIDFIICDHHRPGDDLPEAVAVLDPKRADCNYPYDELCGCGIGFKLIQAIAEKRSRLLSGQNTTDLIPYLDLVATAIGADIVPITGENRILAYFGLEVINTNPRPGFKALIGQTKKKELSITDVVFGIAPKINAAGRMKHGRYAVELLTEMNFEQAEEFAKEIGVFNSDRRAKDQEITLEALQQIKDNGEQKNATSVVYHENWHKGVIGIVASRLIETYYRPTLVFTKSGDKLAASARSVKGFDVYNAIENCAEHLEQFGGHKYAAGLTMLEENYQIFKNKFEEMVKSTIPESCLVPEILIDAPIELSNITPKFYRVLKQMAPFGPGNMSPVFMASGLRDNGFGKKVGQEGLHLKLSIIAGADFKTYNAIGFNLGDKYDLVSNGQAFKAVFTLEENHWNGVTSIQLSLKDIEADN